MRKFFLGLLILLLFVSACSGSDPELVDLRSPAYYNQGTLRFEPTLKNAIKNSTHVVTLSVVSSQPYDYNRLLYTCKVESLLAGELTDDYITVLGGKSFYQEDETYLLFLTLASYPSWPQDIFVPLDIFTFRVVSGDEIDCLQEAGDEEAERARQFIKPFKDPEHNRLSYIEGYVKKNAKSLQKPDTASKNETLDSLLSNSDVVIEIMPTHIEPGNPYVSYVEFEVTSVFKGDFSLGAMFLPSSLELNQKYILFLQGDEEEGFDLTSRAAVLSEGTADYKNFISSWEDK